ncbi:MAG: HD domain-containing phosphohydrolase [Rhodoferax sp.]
MKLLRLPRFKVHVGKPLPWNVRDEQSNLLLLRGHVIDSEHQLELLLVRGAFVDAQEAKAVELHEAPLPERSVPRVLNLFGLWDQSGEEMRKLMLKVPHTPGLVDRVGVFASDLIERVDQDADIALYHAIRQESEDPFLYGYHHAVHTAIVCLLLARRLQWSDARTVSLVKAALTMNMAVLDLQGQLSNQDVPPWESQKALLRRHPQEAFDWLVQAGVDDVDWLTAVAQHHERPDGSGYPQGLSDVSEVALALRMADVFMARITVRKLRPAMTIQEAARQMFQEDQGGALCSAMIKELGIFPPGDVVRLASGEVGVVMRRTDKVKCPIVAAITDTAGHPTVHTQQRDTAQPAFAIVEAVADRTLVARLPPERVYGFASAAAHTAPP